jgi:hypothetical protein
MIALAVFISSGWSFQSSMRCDANDGQQQNAAQLTCLFENVCVTAGKWTYFSDQETKVAEVHIGSFSTSEKLKFRVQPTKTYESSFDRARIISEFTLLTRASNLLFWHWIADELFSIYWTLEHWLRTILPDVSETLSVAESVLQLRQSVRIMLLERVSERASELRGTVTRWPVLFGAGFDGKLTTMKSTLAGREHFDDDATNVCFKWLIVGAASHQLGGPGMRLVDARMTAAFARFVWHAYEAAPLLLRAVPGAALHGDANAMPLLALVDYRERDRLILNRVEVESAMRARLRIDVLFVNLASLPRREQAGVGCIGSS